MFDGIDVTSFRHKYIQGSGWRAIHITSFLCFVKKKKKNDRDFKINASMKRIETQVPLKYLKRYALLPLITDIHLESFMSCSMIQCHNDLHPGGDLLVQVQKQAH